MRLCQLCAVYGDRFWNRRLLRTEHHLSAAGASTQEENLLRFLLNAAVWRHHIDRGGRYCANSGRCDFDGDIVDIKIQDYILLIVLFVLVAVHGLKLPIRIKLSKSTESAFSRGDLDLFARR